MFDRGETSEKTTGSGEFCVGGSTGGIVTTVGDYARFGQMLLNGGELDGVRILGRKTVELMIGNHTGNMEIPITGPGFHWGLGVATYHGRGRLAPLIRSVGKYARPSLGVVVCVRARHRQRVRCGNLRTVVAALATDALRAA